MGGILLRQLLRRRLCGLLLLWAVAPSAYAQQVEPRVSGRIVRADTGTPIAGATVRLEPSLANFNGVAPTAQTNGNGEYRFDVLKDDVFSRYEALKDVPFFVEVSAPRFVGQIWSRDGSLEGKLQTLAPGAQLRADFRLIRDGVIRGVVSDKSGKPVEAGVSVAAVRQEQREDGSERLSPVVFAKTDAAGAFVLEGLAAGPYFVSVNGPNGWVSAKNPGGWYRETWYGDVPSVKGAVVVAVRVGEEQSGIRIAVARENRYNVTVRSVGPEGVQPERYDVALQGRNSTGKNNADGSFLIDDMPPGHYDIVSTAWTGVQYVGQGEAAFDVSDTEVTVRIKVLGLGEVQAAVTWVGAGTLPVGTTIVIESTEGSAQGLPAGADGRIMFDKVLPGNYQFSARREGGGVAVESARCGSVAVTASEPLVVGDRQKVVGCEVVVTEARL